MKWNQGTLTLFKFAVIALVAAVGFWQLHAVDYNWRQALDGSNPWVFFLAMATLPVFGFPISVCYIFAGVSFEPAVAISACLGALAINLSVGYLFANSVFKGPVEAFLACQKWSLPQLSGQNQFRFAFILRTVPGPPFFVQNLALTLAGIPYWTYLWVSLLTQGSIAIAVILCSRNLSQDPQSRTSIIILVLIGLLILGKIANAIRAKIRKTPHKSTQKKT